MYKYAFSCAAKLVLEDTWDEPYAGKPTGKYGETSLHKEGRAARLNLKPANPAKLADLARMAICCGFDYVSFESMYVLPFALNVYVYVQSCLYNYALRIYSYPVVPS